MNRSKTMKRNETMTHPQHPPALSARESTNNEGFRKNFGDINF